MQYLGGKYRIARELCGYLHAVGTFSWWEPFVGGANITPQLRPVIVSDSKLALVSLYRAIRDGWDPPNEVTESEYQAAKKLPETDPMHGFCAAGCSFGGKWWRGYARGDQNYAACASNMLTLLRPSLPARIEHLDFLTCSVPGGVTAIYCDPPYAGTTGYGVPFDNERFWVRCWELARLGYAVFVSEYRCPIPHVLCWEKECNRWLRSSKGKTAVEKLFWIPWA